MGRQVILAIIILFVLVAILAAVVIGVVVFGARRFEGIEQRQDALEHGDWTPTETKHITDSIHKDKSMRALSALLVLALLAPLTAADHFKTGETLPRQLDPTIPADAVQVIEILTRELPLQRVQAQALVQAIQTLAQVVEKAEAAAAAPPDVKAED